MQDWVTPTASLTLGIIRMRCSMHVCYLLTFWTPSAVGTSRRSSPSPLAVGTPPEAVTGTSHEKCRLRSAKPAFGQLNHPIERTSEPRSHHQCLIVCVGSLIHGSAAMVLAPPVRDRAAFSQCQRWQPPARTRASLGPLGVASGSRHTGPGEAREGSRPQCGLGIH